MKRFAFVVFLAIPIAAAALFAADPPPVRPGPATKTYKRGHIAPKNLAELQKASFERHKDRLRQLRATVPPPSWDSRTLNYVGPVKDQAQCGSCWDFSGTGVVEIAEYKARLLKPDGSQTLSEQYTLDCGKNGGCNGDDNTTVLEWAKTTGLPLTSVYGAYTAAAGPCKLPAGATLYKITDWGFADATGSQGVTPIQDIKNAIMEYGCVGSAVAAGSSWDSYTGNIYSGNDTNINHDVILVGWKDDSTIPTGGYWIMRNSWGESWGEKGYMRIAYGADSIGTEAVFALVESAPPPPPPPPPPPGTTLTPGPYTLQPGGSYTFTTPSGMSSDDSKKLKDAIDTIQSILKGQQATSPPPEKIPTPPREDGKQKPCGLETSIPPPAPKNLIEQIAAPAAVALADTGTPLEDKYGVEPRMAYWRSHGFSGDGGKGAGAPLLDKTVTVNGKQVRIQVTQIGEGGGTAPDTGGTPIEGLANSLKKALQQDSPPNTDAAVSLLVKFYIRLKGQKGTSVDEILGIRDSILNLPVWSDVRKLVETRRVVDQFLQDQLKSSQDPAKLAEVLQNVVDTLQGL